MNDAFDPQPTTKAKPRSQARALAVQALYQWAVTKDSASTILTLFEPQLVSADVDAGYFRQLVKGVIETAQALDQELGVLIDRPYKQMETLVRVILYIGAFELRQCIEVPYKVVLNEAVEMAKLFDSDGGKYINGILHQLAKKMRALEVQANA